MRVLQLVAADRWTGAAATALQLVEALRASGVEVHLAYRPGNNLQARLGGDPQAHPILVKERSLSDLRANVARVRALAAGFDLVHAHLPHDHALLRLALGGRHPGPRPPLVRSVRYQRHLRNDAFHRWLFRECAGVGLAHSEMEQRLARLPTAAGRPHRVLPAAVEPRFSRRAGRDEARMRLGVPADACLAGTVGKLSPERGQDLFLHALAGAPRVWGVLVGAGGGEEALRRLARRLRIDGRAAFAGYVEEGLEDLYAAMDVFVFPAAGSDHGHRAVAEASACGLPTLAADLAGIRDLVVPGVTGDLYTAHDAAALAVLLRRWAADRSLCGRAGATAAARAAALWTPARLAEEAIALYREVVARGEE